MKAPSRRSRRQPGWKRYLRAVAQRPTPWFWLGGCLVLYAMAGLILGSLPTPEWIWLLALVGVLAQAAALAGPQSLARFRWLAANLLALAAILGAGGLAVALAIALNLSGSSDLETISPQMLVLSVVQHGLVSLVIAALSAGLLAAAGDRLMGRRRLAASAILGATALLGLGFGASLGLIIGAIG